MELYKIIFWAVLGYLTIAVSVAGLLIRRTVLQRMTTWLGLNIIGQSWHKGKPEEEDDRVLASKLCGLLFPLVATGVTMYWIGYLVFILVIYNFFRYCGIGYSLLADYLGTPKPKKVKLPKARVIGDD